MLEKHLSSTALQHHNKGIELLSSLKRLVNKSIKLHFGNITLEFHNNVYSQESILPICQLEHLITATSIDVSATTETSLALYVVRDSYNFAKFHYLMTFQLECLPAFSPPSIPRFVIIGHQDKLCVFQFSMDPNFENLYLY